MSTQREMMEAKVQQFNKMAKQYEDNLRDWAKKIANERNELKRKLIDANARIQELDRENISLKATQKEKENFLEYLKERSFTERSLPAPLFDILNEYGQLANQVRETDASQADAPKTSVPSTSNMVPEIIVLDEEHGDNQDKLQTPQNANTDDEQQAAETDDETISQIYKC